MLDLPIHTKETAPPDSRPLLDRSEAAFGRIPALHGVMAEAPAVLQGYQDMIALNARTSFTATERHVAWLAVSFENGCSYCMAAHTGLAKLDHVDDPVIEALRDGTPINDTRLEALRRFAAAMVRKRGRSDESDLQAFMEAGFRPRQVLELVLIVSTKTLSNYINHVAETPVDPAMEKFAWQPPAMRSAAQ